MTQAAEAIGRLDPQKWKDTSASERLQLLQDVCQLLEAHADELAATDAKMKNERLGDPLYSISASKMATVVPVGSTMGACIELYSCIARGSMPAPKSVTKVADGLWDCAVFPYSRKDSVMYATREDRLRVKGASPVQINPMDKPPGIVAVLGAGNYSSSSEMVKALFLEGKAVVHKPHEINIETDRVWAKIFDPLVEHGALAFVEDDPERVLNSDPRVTTLYFTGGTSTAQRIMAGTQTPVVSECGGNNPCILVPGEWTRKEIIHQAMVLATLGKLNGGAVCGRAQTIVTSRHWPQRAEFLEALRSAIADGTMAAGTYYPGSEKVAQAFLREHPGAEVLEPEGGKFAHGKFVFIADAPEDGYCVKQEAFCQVMGEVVLDVPTDTSNFLQAATKFCNESLPGTLGCYIVIDETTRKSQHAVLEKCVSELRYGGIGINCVPPMIFLNPYLAWGGNEDGAQFVSGRGNFGNILCLQNVEKSIARDSFVSMGDFVFDSKTKFDSLSESLASYACQGTWMNIFRMLGRVLLHTFDKKDF